MQIWLQHDENNKVAGYSEAPIATDTHWQTEIEITENEFEMLKQNYNLDFDGKTLTFTKPSYLVRKELEETKKTLKDRAKGGKLKLKDLNDFIANFS